MAARNMYELQSEKSERPRDLTPTERKLKTISEQAKADFEARVERDLGMSLIECEEQIARERRGLPPVAVDLSEDPARKVADALERARRVDVEQKMDAASRFIPPPSVDTIPEDGRRSLAGPPAPADAPPAPAPAPAAPSGKKGQ